MFGRLIPGQSRLQSSTRPSSRIRKKCKTREDGAASLSNNDNDSLSAEDSSQMRKKLRHFQKRGGKGKILHPRSQIPPKNGCFTALVHCYIQWTGHSERISDRSDVAEDSHMLVKTLTESLQALARISSSHSLTMLLHRLIMLRLLAIFLKLLMNNAGTNALWAFPYKPMWLQQHGHIERRGRNQLRGVIYMDYL
jgi:hypothetical protein